ncbi:phage holin family protein [Patescibacteria group bacterium]|nr:phage holin family protein [Patescibacteria group bacterium]
MGLLIEGVRVDGGVLTYLLGGFSLSLLFMFVKPILNIFSLPLNILTLGTFSTIANALIFYLLTVFVQNIKITEFTFNGASGAGFTIPQVHINVFFAFIVAAIFQSISVNFFRWLTHK